MRITNTIFVLLAVTISKLHYACASPVLLASAHYGPDPTSSTSGWISTPSGNSNPTVSSGNSGTSGNVGNGGSSGGALGGVTGGLGGVTGGLGGVTGAPGGVSSVAETNCALGSDELAICGLVQTVNGILGAVDATLDGIGL